MLCKLTLERRFVYAEAGHCGSMSEKPESSLWTLHTQACGGGVGGIAGGDRRHDGEELERSSPTYLPHAWKTARG